MAINYTSLFETLGTHVAQLQRLDDIYTDLASYESDMETEYNSNSHLHLYDAALINLKNLRTSIEGLYFQIIDVCTGILTDKELVLDELPALRSEGIDEVLIEMFKDMVDNSQSIAESTVTLGTITKTTTESGAGDVVIDGELSGETPPGDNFQQNIHYLGYTSEIAYTSDDVVVECVDDAVNNGTPGNETFVITGQPTSTSRWSADSIKGSGGGTLLSVADNSNELADGGFESWTGSDLDSWTVADTGSLLSQETTDVFLGSSAGKVTGDGSNDVFIDQDISTFAEAGQRYCIALRYKGEAGISAGTLKVFISGTGYTSAGTDEISLNSAQLAAATSWTTSHFFVTVPKDYPDDLIISIDIEGLSNTHEVLFDNAVMTVATYHAGVGYAVLQGQERFTRNDRFTMTHTNDDASEFQKFFRDAYGVQMPSDDPPTIPNSITAP